MDPAPQRPNWFLRLLGNFAVQRPFYVLGALIVYLPLTGLEGLDLPGQSMLGNLFVDFKFGDGFWFGFALFGAVWAVMLTACLNLDGERDLPDRWTFNLDRNLRRATIPMRHASTFVGFTLLAAPGIVIVIKLAEDPGLTAVGLILGAALAYLCMDVVAFLVGCSSTGFSALPWRPLPLWRLLGVQRLGFIPRLISLVASWAFRAMGLRAHFFKDRDRRVLQDDHFFAIFSLLSLSVVYWVVYRIMKPNSWTHWVNIENLPPVGFIFALLLPLIWLIAGLWFHLRRYRIVLIVFLIYGIFIYGVAERSELLQKYLGGAAHTFDVFQTQEKPLKAGDVLAPLEQSARQNKRNPTLIVVAASGGGILAAGWTSKVLAELHSAYPKFRSELRLISGVSGGSVGTAHYVAAHGDGDAPLPADILKDVVDDSMKTSLSITAYGFAFPDFRRAIFPIWTDEDFDRGRLAEGDWRKTANKLAKKHEKYYAAQRTNAARAGGALSTAKPDADGPVLFSHWQEAVRNGSKPAVIFNTTVMETGRRVLFTPISSVQSKWTGWDSADKTLDPLRYHSASTYGEFIGDGRQWSVDVWTGARLSATFSYVSPAARASFAVFDKGEIERQPPDAGSPALQHIIDGGYHDNSGVASALDWLAAAVEDKSADELPFERIALVEIRAKPFEPTKDPSSQWEAAWLGPVDGILNSWNFAQTAADDTAVNRMIQSFKAYIGKKNRRIQLQSFVFIPVVPNETGPLSWHLSKQQKDFVCKGWLAQRNQRVLKAFLGYVINGDTAKTVQPPKPLDDCAREQKK
jgi:hypothetical protein